MSLLYRLFTFVVMMSAISSVSPVFAQIGAGGLTPSECNITTGAGGSSGAPCAGTFVEPQNLLAGGTIMTGVRSDIGQAAMPILASNGGAIPICKYVDNYSTGATGTSIFVPFNVVSDWAGFLQNSMVQKNVTIQLVDCTEPFGSSMYTVPLPLNYTPACTYVTGSQTSFQAPDWFTRFYTSASQTNYVAPSNYPSPAGETAGEFLCQGGGTTVYSNLLFKPQDNGPWIVQNTYGPNMTLNSSSAAIASGSSVTLTWSMNDTPYGSCTGSSTDGVWNKTPLAENGQGIGSQTLTPSLANSPITYTVTCSDPLHLTNSVASTTVTVQTSLQVAISSNTKSVVSGNPAQFSWVVTNSVGTLNCVPSSTDGSWPSSPVITTASGGPIPITPTVPAGSNVTYQLSCTDSIQNVPSPSNKINIAVTGADCLAQNGLVWGQGGPSGACTGNLAAGVAGDTYQVVNGAANYSGTEQAKCNAGGSWTFSDQTCSSSGGGTGGGSTCAPVATGFEGKCSYTVGQNDACNFGGYVGSSSYQDVVNADNIQGIDPNGDGTLSAVLPYIWTGIACSLPDDNSKTICQDFGGNPNAAPFITNQIANDVAPVGTTGTVVGSIIAGNGTTYNTYGNINWSWSIRLCSNDEHSLETCGPIDVKISRVCPDCVPPVPLKYDSCYGTFNGEACKVSQDGLMCDYFTNYCDKAGVLEQLSITYWPTADGDPPCGAFRGFGK